MLEVGGLGPGWEGVGGGQSVSIQADHVRHQKDLVDSGGHPLGQRG